MLDLYKNIREKRKALKMSQEDLALKVGYTNRSTIATIEAGRMDIPVSKIKEIAKALDCDAADLMGLADDQDFQDGAEDAKLILQFHKLSKDHQDMIMKQIELFLQMEK